MKSLLMLGGGLLCFFVIWQISPYISWDGSAIPFEQSFQGKHAYLWKLMVFLFSPVAVVLLALIMVGFFLIPVAAIYKKITRPSFKA